MHLIRDFKNIRNGQIDLDRPLTLLIGRNGAGKSNVVEAVELLAQLAQGRQLHEITDAGRGGAFQVRGGLHGCIPYGSSELWLEIARPGVNYDVRIAANGHARITWENVNASDRTAFNARPSANPDLLEVVYDNFDRGPNKPTAQRPADRSVLSQYEVLPIKKRNEVYEKMLRTVEDLRTYLRSSFVFDPQSRLMRTYERVGDDVLASDGRNLSAVLYSLASANSSEGVASLARLLGWIRQLPEEPYDGINFVKTELNDVIFGLLRSGSTELVDAKVLSDGTLRCLAILTALETVKHGSRVIIEEFDNGVSPSRVQVLTDAVQDCAERRRINVVCTTQNPATLNALTPEQLKGVVVCHWRPEAKSSTLTRLLEVPGADILLERGQLGDLVTRRILEEHLIPGFEEQRRVEAKRWLESLP